MRAVPLAVAATLLLSGSGPGVRLMLLMRGEKVIGALVASDEVVASDKGVEAVYTR